MTDKFVLRKIQLERYVQSIATGRRIEQWNFSNGADGKVLEPNLDAFRINAGEDGDDNKKYVEKGRV